MRGLDPRKSTGLRWSYSAPFGRSFHVCFESLQLICPETFHLDHPVAKLLEGFAAKLQDPGSRIFLKQFLFYEASSSQDPQVTAHRGASDIEYIRYFARPQWALAQQFNDGAARGVCQSS